MQRRSAMPEAEPTTEPLCELRERVARVRAAQRQPLRVLDDISLAIQPNEIVALLGPSGCGKSTILRILAGLIRPTAGEVLLPRRAAGRAQPGRGHRLPELRALSRG